MKPAGANLTRAKSARSAVAITICFQGTFLDHPSRSNAQYIFGDGWL